MKQRYIPYFVVAIGLVLTVAACSSKGMEQQVEPSPAPEVEAEELRAQEISEDELIALLKTEDYQEQSIAAFNEAFRPYQHSFTGFGPSHPDPEFMETLSFSTMELLAVENGDTPSLRTGSGIGNCMVDYTIYWEIADPHTVTVGQRDDLLINSLEKVQDAFWFPTGAGEDESDVLLGHIQLRCDQVAGALSTEWATLEIVVEAIQYYDEE